MSYYGQVLPIETLVGKVLTKVENVLDEELHFYAADGTAYRLYHEQDCCESVRIEDITGNLADLVGSPITLAREASSGDWPTDVPRPEWLDSFTWTFYSFATVKGYVDVRFLGESNGSYSEEVDFAEMPA